MKSKKYVCMLFAVSLLIYSTIIWEEPVLKVMGRMKDEVTIVIDAGHGGIDGGATAYDGTMEKDITLKIAKELEKIMKDYPVNVIMTRTNDGGLYNENEGTIRSKKTQDLIRRKEIFDGENVDLAVSIHLNSFPQDESVYGAQVFYPAQTEVRTSGLVDEHTSESYAKSVQKSLEINISDGRERVEMKKDNIVIFDGPLCPVILVECGFMSNKNELNRLKTAEYQGLLASAIWEGLNANLCLKKHTELKVIDSANKK